MVTFHCEHCGRKMTAGDGLAEKWIRCPGCLRLTLVVDSGQVGRVPFKSVCDRLRLAYYMNGGASGRNAATDRTGW